LLLIIIVIGCAKQEKSQSINLGKDTIVNKSATDKNVQSNKDSINIKKDSMNIKEQSFNDFAKIFMNEAFESPEKLLNYSEDKITTYSGVEGTNTTTPQKEYKELKRFRKILSKICS